jgi:hypothetical protein
VLPPANSSIQTLERRYIMMKLFVLCVLGYVAQVIIFALVIKLIDRQSRWLLEKQSGWIW